MQAEIQTNQVNVGAFPVFQNYLETANVKSVFQLVQAAIREEMLPSPYESKNGLVVPLWKARKLLLLEGGREVSLSRLSGLTTVTLFDNASGASRRLTKMQEFLTLLAQEVGVSLSDVSWRQFQEELENGIQNNAMCMLYRDEWNAGLADDVTKSAHPSFWEWITHEALDINADLFFEQWAAVGHLYHPCSKTKLGLLPNDVLRYGPEFKGGAQVRLAAVRKEFLEVECSDARGLGLHEWLKENYPEWVATWQARLTEAGLAQDDYLPMPMHPWQAEHAVPQRFAHELEENHIALLDGPEQNLASTMSFRTMAPRQGQACHVKLPVAVQATSAVRTVSPASVHTGPKVSRILNKIRQRDNRIGENLRVLSEYLGAHFARPGMIHDDDCRFLSVLFRQNPASATQKGETALAVAALFVTSPLNQKPLIAEIMTAAGVKGEEQVLSYFRDYVDVVLTGHLDLYLKYGIALEAHQQNALAVFDENHRPRAMMARDFGGVRIYAPQLKAQGLDLQGYPGAVTVTDDLVETRNKFLHAVMQGHLGEMVLMLHTHYQMDEAALWNVVKEGVESRFDACRADVDEGRWLSEKHGILMQDWNLKALTRMRLDETSHHYIYIPLKNPLRV